MNRDQKAAVIEEVATEITESEAILAVDYRGISVRQAKDLRVQLGEAGTSFRVVKNTLTERAADKAGAAELKAFLEGPTAFAFVRGDAALAAKALAAFRRESRLLEFKGGVIGERVLTVEDVEALSRLPGREALQGQFVGVLASPLTGLVRGLGSLVSGLAVALGQIQEQGLVGGGAAAEAPASDEPKAEAPSDEEAAEESSTLEEPADDDEPGGEPGGEPVAPGDPVSEAAAAEEEDAEPEQTEETTADDQAS